MDEGAGENDWAQTSLIVAKLHNVNCVKKADQVPPDAFNPYAEHIEAPVVKVPLASLKNVFLGG